MWNLEQTVKELFINSLTRDGARFTHNTRVVPRSQQACPGCEKAGKLKFH